MSVFVSESVLCLKHFAYGLFRRFLLRLHIVTL